eukprot:Clim_evm2s240 gene=Clim_evmTU2s240
MTYGQVDIVTAVRTPVGAFNGGLSSFPASDLGSAVIKECLKRGNVNPDDVDEVIMGQVLTASTGQGPARQASIGAGIPKEVPAYSVNMLCGSGLKAVGLAYQSIRAGDNTVVVAGGQESMSRAPHAVHMRAGTKFGPATMEDTMIKDGLTDAFSNIHMGITAENVAKMYSVSRQDQDEFAAESQRKAAEATNAGKFEAEILPISVPQRKGDPIIVNKDEGIRSNTTADGLAKLRPAFSKDAEASVTAGNASTLNDGAAAMLVMDHNETLKRGLKPMARIVSWGQAGVDPKIMGMGPLPAMEKALKRAGWTYADLDLAEVNEAFASQSLAVRRETDLKPEVINVNGGAIAIGHPIGASGARILVTLLHALQQSGKKRGIAALCIGGGMGVAMCVEMCE